MLAKVSRVTQVLKQVLHEQAVAGLRDGQLLELFVGGGDETAFATLMERHGPMVLGLCERVLGNHEDAADALQATFLVMARRATAIKKPDSLGAWLHGVAYRVAMQMRSSRDKRRKQERTLPARAPAGAADPSWREMLAILDEEMQRLPDKHRQPLVLCFLEGLTQQEAADQLGWPRGT